MFFLVIGCLTSECKTFKAKMHCFAKENYLSDGNKYAQYSSLQKEYKRVVQQKRRQHLYSIRKKLENMSSNNPNDYWKVLRNLSKTRQTDDIELNDFYSYFSETASPTQTDHFDLQFLECIRNIDLNESEDKLDVDYDKMLRIREILNQPICESELQIHLRKLKNCKASGIDGLSTEFIKYTETKLLYPLLCLYNYMLKSGDFPAQWSEGVINPLHKNGSKVNHDNYRRITVLVTLV